MAVQPVVIIREVKQSLDLRMLAVAAASLALPLAGGDRDWPVYLGDSGSRQYSALRQITRENVDQLEVAWIYRSGDARADNLSQIQGNPLIIDGVLYGTTPATYQVGTRQFVVIACGGGKMATPSGDAYVAFALP